MKKKFLSLLFLLSVAYVPLNAQIGLLNQQAYYKNSVPAGNYSGLSRIGGNRYVVVNDKPKNDGFDIFHIDIDSITGEIANVRRVGSLSSGRAGTRDGEGIAYFKPANTVFISGETDNRVLEYDMDGQLTGRELKLRFGYQRTIGQLRFGVADIQRSHSPASGRQRRAPCRRTVSRPTLSTAFATGCG